jgi:hypothetical protein
MLYGERLSGIFGYSHFVGVYAGGQVGYVRVLFGDQNLLHLPDNVPFEKRMLPAKFRTDYNTNTRQDYIFLTFSQHHTIVYLTPEYLRVILLLYGVLTLLALCPVLGFQEGCEVGDWYRQQLAHRICKVKNPWVDYYQP